MRYTKEDIARRAALIRVNYRAGRLTPTEIAQYESLPNWTWDKQKHNWTKEEIITELKHLSVFLKHTPLVRELNKHGAVSARPVYKLFGNYNNALRAAVAET